MISIIIPAWNEEKYLPRLLDSIKQQTYRDYEIIVADADSEDNTKKIAKRYGCKIVKGGMPAAGRNNGAKIAKGDLLVFLDADSLIDKNFLRDIIKEFEERKLDVGAVYLHSIEKGVINKAFLGIWNITVWMTQYFFPGASGGGIICKRWLHGKIKGFDTTIMLGEDADYVNRAGKYGKFRMLHSPRLYFSMRRYSQKNPFVEGLKIALHFFHRIFFGEIKKNTFKYDLRYRKIGK